MARAKFGGRLSCLGLLAAAVLLVHPPVALALARGASFDLVLRLAPAAPGQGLIQPADEALPLIATSFQFTCGQTRNATSGFATGRLTDALGAYVSAAPVVLQSSPDALNWTECAEAVTDASGGFSAALPVTRHYYLRAVFQGDAVHDAATSALGVMEYRPALALAVTPPALVHLGTKVVLKVTAAVESHDGSPCVGVFHFIRNEKSGMVERKAVTVHGVYNAASGCMEYPVNTAIPFTGNWMVEFTLAADAWHEAMTLWAPNVLVGSTTVTQSLSKVSVAVGGKVLVTGHVVDAVNKANMRGVTLRLESSIDFEHWSKVSSMRTSKNGKAVFTVRPRFRHFYRVVYPETTAHMRGVAAFTLVSTYFTITGTKAAHLTKKKVWMSLGARAMTVVLDGTSQTVSIHTQDESQKELLATGPGMFSGSLQMLSACYVHFKITGNGYYRVTVWN